MMIRLALTVLALGLACAGCADNTGYVITPGLPSPGCADGRTPGPAGECLSAAAVSELKEAKLVPAVEDVPRLYLDFIARERCPDQAYCGVPPVRTVSRVSCQRSDEELPAEAQCAFRVEISYRRIRGLALTGQEYDCIGLFAQHPEGWRMYGFADACRESHRGTPALYPEGHRQDYRGSRSRSRSQGRLRRAGRTGRCADRRRPCELWVRSIGL